MHLRPMSGVPGAMQNSASLAATAALEDSQDNPPDGPEVTQASLFITNGHLPVSTMPMSQSSVVAWDPQRKPSVLQAQSVPQVFGRWSLFALHQPGPPCTLSWQAFTACSDTKILQKLSRWTSPGSHTCRYSETPPWCVLKSIHSSLQHVISCSLCDP